MNARFNDHDAEPADSALISLQDEPEVLYWTTRLGVSRNQLRQAIDEVGASSAQVEAWLRYQGHPTT